MPDVTFRCPACENPIAADMSMGGAIVSCPHCSANIPVPGTHPPPIPQPQPLRPAPSPPSEWNTLLKFIQLFGVIFIGVGIFVVFTAGTVPEMPARHAESGASIFWIGVLFWGIGTAIRWLNKP